MEPMLPFLILSCAVALSIVIVAVALAWKLVHESFDDDDVEEDVELVPTQAKIETDLNKRLDIVQNATYGRVLLNDVRARGNRSPFSMPPRKKFRS
jgi:hypothetical protein